MDEESEGDSDDHDNELDNEEMRTVGGPGSVSQSMRDRASYSRLLRAVKGY